MSTNNNKEVDYEEYLRTKKPEKKKRSGIKEREERRRLKAQKEKITIRLDKEVLEKFKQMTPEGKGYQNLINQALREWLSAQGVKELIREELTGLVAEAVEHFKEDEQIIRG